MAQAESLVNALKNVLKARGVTYAQLAKGLDLSEASVKRVFAERSFTLERLDQICGLLEMQISDLARMVAEDNPAPAHLTREQEKKLVSDPKLLLVAVHVLNRWTPEQIVDAYQLPRTELIRLLTQLDKLGIIDLLPNDRIRLRMAPDFSWLPAGPIQQYFRDQLRNDFFNSHFDQSGEKMLMISGMLSEESNAELQRRMARLAKEFLKAHRQDLALPLERRHGNALIVAMRPWIPDSFKRLKRQDG